MHDNDNLIPVFFWSEDAHPSQFVNPSIPAEDRIRMAWILKDGENVMSYRGVAACRICRRMVGSCDYAGYGFKWPQGAEHYVTEHQVWPPGADALLDAAQK